MKSSLLQVYRISLIFMFLSPVVYKKEHWFDVLLIFSLDDILLETVYLCCMFLLSWLSSMYNWWTLIMILNFFQRYCVWSGDWLWKNSGPICPFSTWLSEHYDQLWWIIHGVKIIFEVLEDWKFFWMDLEFLQLIAWLGTSRQSMKKGDLFELPEIYIFSCIYYDEDQSTCYWFHFFW